ncbi:hypothetical protein [Methanosarcina barkeri]|nr:hypothetical protein [Methanosarcina barkeri]
MFEFEELIPNPIGVITIIFKKGLTEKPSNELVGMINRHNG